jgi:hypothetical protein
MRLRDLESDVLFTSVPQQPLKGEGQNLAAINFELSNFCSEQRSAIQNLRATCEQKNWIKEVYAKFCPKA